MTTRNKTCCVCGKENIPYKCPNCRESYCSSLCFKTHKETPCCPVEPKIALKEASVEKVYEFPTRDTVPIAKLERLKDNQELKNSLANPHVRDIVRAILTSKDATEAIALAMTEPIFVELADACLKVVETEDKNSAVEEIASVVETSTNMQELAHACVQINELQQAETP